MSSESTPTATSVASGSSASIPVKLSVLGEFRRFNVSGFDNLRSVVRTILGNDSFAIRYTDNDGDEVSLTNQDEFSVAASLVPAAGALRCSAVSTRKEEKKLVKKTHKQQRKVNKKEKKLRKKQQQTDSSSSSEISESSGDAGIDASDSSVSTSESPSDESPAVEKKQHKKEKKAAKKLRKVAKKQHKSVDVESSDSIDSSADPEGATALEDLRAKLNRLEESYKKQKQEKRASKVAKKEQKKSSKQEKKQDKKLRKKSAKPVVESSESSESSVSSTEESPVHETSFSKKEAKRARRDTKKSAKKEKKLHKRLHKKAKKAVVESDSSDSSSSSAEEISSSESSLSSSEKKPLSRKKELKQLGKVSRQALKEEVRQAKERFFEAKKKLHSELKAAKVEAKRRDFDSRFVAHVTFPDPATVEANATILKTFKFRNTGQTVWPADAKLLFVSRFDNSLQAPDSVDLGREVKPEEELEITVPLKAPAKQGQYDAFFRLALANGRKFGQRVRSRIVVGATAPAAPRAAPLSPSPFDSGVILVAETSTAVTGDEPVLA
jgi:hypothetical protein